MPLFLPLFLRLIPCVLASLGTSHKEAGAIKRLALYILDASHNRRCGVPHVCVQIRSQ